MRSAGLVLSQREALDAPLAAVGGKAAMLARLTAAGLPVPPFFAVTSDALALHLQRNGISWPGRDPSTQYVAAVAAEIARAPVPPELADQVLQAYAAQSRDTGRRRVAVRSSGADEDGSLASFAGQFDSVLNVEGSTAVLEALSRCWASCLSDGSMGYRRAAGVPLGGEPRFGVIVQTQVFAQKAGVLFTVHPLEAEGTAYLEANFGSGASVAGGIATPDAITLSRSGDAVSVRVATKRRATWATPDRPGTVIADLDAASRDAAVLSEAEATRILRMGLRIEELLGGPQDVEWAMDHEGLWLLQSRPVTGLGPRTMPA